MDDPAPPDDDPEGKIVRFPQSRAGGSAAARPYRVLGTSQFTARFGAPDRQATGHWCSRCEGIWFGYPLEVTCPACGNRHG